MEKLKSILLECVELEEQAMLETFANSVCKIMSGEWTYSSALKYIVSINTTNGKVVFSANDIEIEINNNTFKARIVETDAYKEHYADLQRVILNRMLEKA